MKARHLVFALPALLGGLATSWSAGETTFAQAAKNQPAAASYQSKEVIEDLGEIKEGAEEAMKYRANLTTTGTFTSNAKLSGNHGSGDFLFFPTLTGGFNKQLTKQISIDLEAKLESALYSRFSERSFAGYSAIATLDYRHKTNLPRLYISAEPYRYDNYDEGDLITQAVGVSVGTDWGYAFNRGNSLVLFGYNFTEYLSDPNIDDRHTHRTVLGLAHQFKPQLYGQVLYTFMHTGFEEIDRRDLRHVFAANLIYQFNHHLFGSLSASFVDNDSTQLRGSYQSAATSVALSWQF
ncbi:MAG: outer membrane beta-barrel protein [Verrucomicrobiota bacterium]